VCPPRVADIKLALLPTDRLTDDGHTIGSVCPSAYFHLIFEPRDA